MSHSMDRSLLWLGVFIKVTWIRATLLYPAASLLQLTASLSVPVIDLPPQRRVGFDWGLQMNYDMPFNLSQFYNVPIWPIHRNMSKRATGSALKGSHHLDFGLLDFYRHLERSLESFGFHKSCLLLCICELAQQPNKWLNLNFLSKFLNFLARPSLLLENSMLNKSTIMAAYLAAEERGFQNENCYNFYGSCDQN